MSGSRTPLLVAALCLLPVDQGDAQTATLTLSATLLPACEAGSSSGSSITFGTLDFGQYARLSSNVSVTSQPGAGSIRVKCVNGQSFSIRLDGGLYGTVTQRRMANTANSALTIAYNLYRDKPGGILWDNTTGVSASGTGADQWFAIYGQVPAQTTPAAGRYTDTVNVTVSW
jgi:spore coat protein U-like protein